MLRLLITVAGLFLICMLLIVRECRQYAQKISLEGFEAAVVAYVIDGDTIIVSGDGGERRVRLNGIDCEESVSRDPDKNTDKGREASEFTKKLLPKGRNVYLQKDTSETDRYGRLLRYVWLELPSDAEDKEEIREKMVSAILVDHGMARTMDIAPDLLYSEILHEIEDQNGQP